MRCVGCTTEINFISDQQTFIFNFHREPPANQILLYEVSKHNHAKKINDKFDLESSKRKD